VQDKKSVQNQDKKSMQNLVERITKKRIKAGEVKKFSEAVDELVNAGCDINEKISYKEKGKKVESNLFGFCASIGNQDFVKCLLQKQALQEAYKNSQLTTITSKSIESNQSHTFFNVMLKGNDDKEYDLNAMLHRAIKTRDEETVEICLQTGADPNTCDKKGSPALYVALEHKDEPHAIVKLLCDANVNLQPILFNDEKINPLGFALQNKHLESACLLLKYIIKDDNYPIEVLYACLHDALHPENKKFLKALLNTKKLNINHASIDLLLPAFLSVNDSKQTQKYKVTPLNFASCYNYIDVMEILCDHGAYAHCLDSQSGGNLLHVTVGRGHYEATQFLLDKGVKNIKDNNGNEPLYYAPKLSHENSASLLKSHTNKQSLIGAKSFNNLNIGAALCRNGADLYFITSNNLPFLHELILFEQIELANEFLESKLVTQDSRGNDAFIFAISINSIDMVNLFLKYFDPLKKITLISPFFAALLEQTRTEDASRNKVLSILYLKNKRNTIEEINNHIQYCLSLAEKLFEDSDIAQKMRFTLMAIHKQINPNPICTIDEEQSQSYNPTFFSQEKTNKGMTGFQYLKIEHQWSKEDIQKAKDELTRNKQDLEKVPNLIPISTIIAPSLFSWFDNGIDSLNSAVLQIEHANSSGQSFLWISEDEMENQGASQEDLMRFTNKDRYTFASNNIKKLSDIDYSEYYEINGQIHNLTVTHELKISDSPARILLFPIHSDDGNATLYLGLKYLKHGLHLSNDSQCLQNSMLGEKKPKIIKLPIEQEEKSTTMSLNF
jgi:ankyrin repeat protein